MTVDNADKVALLFCALFPFEGSSDHEAKAAGTSYIKSRFRSPDTHSGICAEGPRSMPDGDTGQTIVARGSLLKLESCARLGRSAFTTASPGPNWMLCCGTAPSTRLCGQLLMPRNVILKMGVKGKFLYRDQATWGWGPDTHLYPSAGRFNGPVSQRLESEVRGSSHKTVANWRSAYGRRTSFRRLAQPTLPMFTCCPGPRAGRTTRGARRTSLKNAARHFDNCRIARRSNHSSRAARRGGA